QRLDQLLRSSKLERDHIDDNVCVKASDPRAEFALGFFGLAVHNDLFDSFPGRMLFIGRCRATADVYNRVSTLDKLGHEVGSHMSISSNDDDPSHGFLLRLSTFQSHSGQWDRGICTMVRITGFVQLYSSRRAFV